MKADPLSQASDCHCPKHLIVGVLPTIIIVTSASSLLGCSSIQPSNSEEDPTQLFRSVQQEQRWGQARNGRTVKPSNAHDCRLIGEDGKGVKASLLPSNEIFRRCRSSMNLGSEATTTRTLSPPCSIKQARITKFGPACAFKEQKPHHNSWSSCKDRVWYRRTTFNLY